MGKTTENQNTGFEVALFVIWGVYPELRSVGDDGNTTVLCLGLYSTRNYAARLSSQLMFTNHVVVGEQRRLKHLSFCLVSGAGKPIHDLKDITL